MTQKLEHKDLLTLADFSGAELRLLLQEAEGLRALGSRYAQMGEFLRGQTVSMLFALPSTRTRAAAELAILQSGGHPLFLAKETLQVARGENARDTIKCLEPYSAAFIIRTHDHEFLETAAAATTRPVINALSATAHPVEALAQFLTVNKLQVTKFEKRAGKDRRQNVEQERESGSGRRLQPDRRSGVDRRQQMRLTALGGFADVKCAYIGDTSNVAVSLAQCAAKLDIELMLAAPPAYAWPQALKKQLRGTSVSFTTDAAAAVKNADIVFGDTYVSMGQEDERSAREKAFQPYQVNAKLMKHASSHYTYLHCLPAYRGQEVSAEIIDGDHSAVYAIAEHRVLIYRALLKLLVG